MPNTGKINFASVLDSYRQLIWPEINVYLKKLSQFPPYCQIPLAYSSLADFNQQIISNYPQRLGKYLRPTLVMLSAQAMGVEASKAITTAAAMQISEDWILNHDDIEDDSLFRRGAPTLHRQIGCELAINAGDGLHLLMWQVLRQNFVELDTPLALKIYDEFTVMLNRTVLGQTVEIKWTQDNRLDLTIDDVLFILESKTGYYTIAGPMRLGAILAGATEAQLNSLYTFGKYLGQAFQIVDDLLDLTSDFAGLKKQVGNDIYEGKRTVILVHLLNNISAVNKEKLMTILSQNRAAKTPADIAWVIAQMHTCGSLDFASKLAKECASHARQIFANELTFLVQEPYRSQIQSGLDFIVNRDH